MSDLPAYMRWLPAASLQKIGKLEFLAHGAVDGFVAGRHKSVRKGSSVEFAEHRQYVPGDDIRSLDWKIVARTRRLYIREFVDETNLRATVVLDSSGSMNFRGKKAYAGLTKLNYAKHLAALFSYLLINQQDAVGLVTYDSLIRNFIPAKSRPAQLKNILESVNSLECGGETQTADVLHDVAERIPRRGVVLLLSDFFSEINSLIKALHHLRYRKHEVIAVQIVADEELNFPYSRMSRFEDLESSSFLDIDTRAIRNEYLKRFNKHHNEFKRACGEMHITGESVSTSTPFDEALADILIRYHQNGGRG